MNRDLMFAVGALALAVVYYLMAAAIPTSALADAVGPGGLPKSYAIVLGGLSLMLMAQAILRRRVAARAAREDAEKPVARVQRLHLYRAAGMLAIGGIYVLAAPWLGYVLTLAALIAVTTYYQGGGFGGRVWIIALGGALFYWVLFVWVLRIPQPPGFWPDLF